MDIHGAMGKAIMSLITGAVLGWSASALTIAGRVSAVEGSLSRIEQRLDQLVTTEGKAK